MNKKILIIGGGGREHALCHAASRSAAAPEIYCAPGNAGIAQIAHCAHVSATDIPNLLNFALTQKINLTIVGGESSLAAGITDEFEKNNLKIVGASRQAAQLETSKIFAKDFMSRHNIPTAKYQTAASPAEALQILNSGHFGDESAPVVVKADGLAAGKGVVIAKNRAEAVAAINEMMTDGNKAASRIVLEETLVGKEVSLLLFADGTDYALMPPARDHKRIGEGDTGANTGGMGTITDDSLLDETQLNQIAEKIIKPTLAGAAAEGFPFRGILFLGLMMTAEGAKTLEYNVRFGDPEAQSILIRLKSDFVELCEAVVNGELARTKIEFSAESSACIVMAAAGYPAEPHTGDVISGLDEAAQIENVQIYHAGTKFNEQKEYLTAGGRVLGVTATGRDVAEARARAYSGVEKIAWRGAQFRRDIGL